jgi:hypothetical protein
MRTKLITGTLRIETDNCLKINILGFISFGLLELAEKYRRKSLKNKEQKGGGVFCRQATTDDPRQVFYSPEFIREHPSDPRYPRPLFALLHAPRQRGSLL